LLEDELAQWEFKPVIGRIDGVTFAVRHRSALHAHSRRLLGRFL